MDVYLRKLMTLTILAIVDANLVGIIGFGLFLIMKDIKLVQDNRVGLISDDMHELVLIMNIYVNLIDYNGHYSF